MSNSLNLLTVRKLNVTPSTVYAWLQMTQLSTHQVSKGINWKKKVPFAAVFEREYALSPEEYGIKSWIFPSELFQHTFKIMHVSMWRVVLFTADTGWCLRFFLFNFYISFPFLARQKHTLVPKLTFSSSMHVRLWYHSCDQFISISGNSRKCNDVTTILSTDFPS